MGFGGWAGFGLVEKRKKTLQKGLSRNDGNGNLDFKPGAFG